MNSREKGKRGERQWRDELRAHGYAAQRGQQYAGSPESPDVVCADLPWIHFEVKLRERLDIYDAVEQARRECGGKVPVVAHRRSQWPWLITIEGEAFFRFVAGELPPASVEVRFQRAGEGGFQPPALEAGKGADAQLNTQQDAALTGSQGWLPPHSSQGNQFGDVLENVPTQKKRDALERVPTNKN